MVSCAFTRDGSIWGTVLDFFVFKNIESVMTETNFFLQIKLLSSPYSDACTQVHLEIAFMRKTVQALPPIDVKKLSVHQLPNWKKRGK